MMVMDKAAELGRALAESEAFVRYLHARDKADEDSETTQRIMVYQSKEKEMMSASQANDALLAAKLQKELDELRVQIEASPAMSELAIAQNEFQMLMAQVNQVIGQFINPDSGCGGCSGCDGEHHNCDGSCH